MSILRLFTHDRDNADVLYSAVDYSEQPSAGLVLGRPEPRRRHPTPDNQRQSKAQGLQHRGHFAELDFNRDGVVDQQEWEQLLPIPPPPPISDGECVKRLDEIKGHLERLKEHALAQLPSEATSSGLHTYVPQVGEDSLSAAMRRRQIRPVSSSSAYEEVQDAVIRLQKEFLTDLAKSVEAQGHVDFLKGAVLTLLQAVGWLVDSHKESSSNQGDVLLALHSQVASHHSVLQTFKSQSSTIQRNLEETQSKAEQQVQIWEQLEQQLRRHQEQNEACWVEHERELPRAAAAQADKMQLMDTTLRRDVTELCRPPLVPF